MSDAPGLPCDDLAWGGMTLEQVAALTSLNDETLLRANGFDPSVADAATVPAVPRAADPVGLQEIIERLGVSGSTPRQWRYRGIFPKPDYEAINGLQAWEWETVLRWCGATGRLMPGTAPYEEFVERFGTKPLEPRVGGSMTQEQQARSENLLNPRKRKQP